MRAGVRARTMATLAACGVATMLAGCMGSKQEVAEAQPAPPPDLTRSDCYTVTLFDGFDIKPPPEGTPVAHAAFLGEWRFGAWDGKWCHDLLVTEILDDGTVILMDKHAPYVPWGQPATAFERKGRIDQNGVLRFRHGTTQRSYRLDADSGRLVGMREDVNGALTAELRRSGVSLVAPVPPTRADALARRSATAAATGITPTASEG
ncbi:MAG: hypothetical protein AAF577_15605 [Pseudomonadota bacterium]